MNEHNTQPGGIDELLEGCAPIIEKRGYIVIASPLDARARRPSIAYTIGLEQGLNHPELVLLGAPPEVASTILGTIAARIEKSGVPVDLHAPLTEILKDYALILKPASSDVARPYMEVANAWYERNGRDYRVVQIVWPDSKGHFPWHAQYDKQHAKKQPLLFSPQ